MISIQQSDAVKWANEYDGPLFHALLCDPPYHLTSPVSKSGSQPLDGVHGRFGRIQNGKSGNKRVGFMGKVWDGGDIAFQPETWFAFMRVLHPGAFGMAFASSRGWHRLAVAIEDAGFIIHPSIFLWCQGQGFPKASRIDTQIDRQAGKFDERKVVGKYQPPNGQEWNLEQADNPEIEHAEPTFTASGVRTLDIVEPATELAKAWVGHRYGLQALKPAVEPIIVFQKPYEGRPVDCMVETGAGALNIDGGRIETDDSLIHGGSLVTNSGDTRTGKALGMFQDGTPNTFVQHPSGRWPSNFILEDEEAARALDEQSGKRSGGHYSGKVPEDGGLYKLGLKQVEDKGYTESGYASRFFFNVQEQIDESDPVYYCSKASKTERNSGLDCYVTVKYNCGEMESGLWKEENTELEILLRKVISEWEITNFNIAVFGENITVLCQKDSLSITRTVISRITESKILNWLMQLPTNECTAIANSGTEFGIKNAKSVGNTNQLTYKTGIFLKKDGLNMADVAHAIFELLSKIKDEEGWKEWRSGHPTHKPIALTKYLATLLLPPEMYAPRRIFVPFAGVASECIGAYQAGWEEIVGVEREKEYCEIAEARVRYWSSKPIQKEMF